MTWDSRPMCQVCRQRADRVQQWERLVRMRPEPSGLISETEPLSPQSVSPFVTVTSQESMCQPCGRAWAKGLKA